MTMRTQRFVVDVPQPLQVPFRDFGEVDLFRCSPTKYWRFTIDGLVENPCEFTFDELKAHPQTTSRRTLVSIDNPTGGRGFFTATWEGILLSDLLRDVAILPTATHVVFHRHDRYSIYLDLQLGSHPQALLALRMNGRPLWREHGQPTRLLIPGVYDYKMPRWIKRIEFTNQPQPDFWEQRGWSPRGIVQTHSIILSPRHNENVGGPLRIEGIAFGGGRLITNVEVSVDDRGWMPATLHPLCDPLAAVDWFIDWQPPMSGSYRIAARATDERGFTQYLRQHHPKPDGSSAIHHVVVHVVDSNP